MTPFAFLEIPPDRLNSFLTYVLSIIGGAVAGYVGAVVIGKLVDRAARVKTADGVPFVHRLFRGLTALAVAILIAIYFFPGGGGGKGTGDGKDDGPDKPNKPTGDGTDPTKPVTPTQTPPTKGTVLDPDERARAVIRLEILGGTDAFVGDRKDYFFREVGKTEQFPLAGVEKLVNDRKAILKPGVGVAIEYRLTRYSKDDPNFQGLTTLRSWGIAKQVSVDPADK